MVKKWRLVTLVDRMARSPALCIDELVGIRGR
jgi:hypothetical protein